MIEHWHTGHVITYAWYYDTKHVKVLENRFDPRNGTQVGIQEVILLRFDTLPRDKILCSCAVKITHTEAGSSPIEYVLTGDKILVTEVVTARGNLATLYKRDLRSLVTVRCF